jgi:hypothetical protein
MLSDFTTEENFTETIDEIMSMLAELGNEVQGLNYNMGLQKKLDELHKHFNSKYHPEEKPNKVYGSAFDKELLQQLKSINEVYTKTLDLMG